MKIMHGPPRGFPSSAALLRAFSTGLLMLAAAAPIARAELVIFTNGRVVKAISHRAAGGQIEIRLPGGGSYSVDRTLVERIVDDEVAGADVQAPQQPPRHVEASQPTRDVQAPQQPPRDVEASRRASNEQVATPTGPQETPRAGQASEENSLRPRRRHHHHR